MQFNLVIFDLQSLKEAPLDSLGIKDTLLPVAIDELLPRLQYKGKSCTWAVMETELVGMGVGEELECACRRAARTFFTENLQPLPWIHHC